MTEPRTVRVVLADDHPLYRLGLRAVLSTINGLEVAGEASTVAEALTAVARLSPDLVIADISMPAPSGLEIVRRLRPAGRVRVLFVSMHRDRELCDQALSLGAHGYVVKEDAGIEIRAAVAAAMRDEVYVSTVLRTETLKGAPRETLTDREREVVRLIARGNTSTDIASALGISTRTAETHRANLMRKLELHNTAAVVRWAVEHGLE